MTQAEPIRILLADDHAILREGLRTIIELEPDMKVVGEAGDGLEAIELYRRTQPDILLLDLYMPELEGIQVIERVRGEFPQARILVLTTYGGDEDIFGSLKAGAKGYLLKDTPRRKLLEALRAVQCGERAIPPAVAAKMAERFSNPQLTPRELEVLRCVAKGKSNKEIASQLFVQEGTVKTHVNSLLRKLGASGRTEAVTTGLRRGLVRL